MRDPIKINEKIREGVIHTSNQEKRATTVVNMGTRVEFLRKENKTSPVRNSKRMDMMLNNVTSIIIWARMHLLSQEGSREKGLLE